MPQEEPVSQLPAPNDVIDAPYPAGTKQAAGEINGLLTDVMCLSFDDKIIIHVPLDTANPTYAEQHLPVEEGDQDLLPMSHLTPTTLLGGTVPERETMGQLFATQVASTIATKYPEETRMVVVGLGLHKADTSRESFFDIVELVMKCF
ncbi:MAG: hypothetical protein M1838_001943 [Thelocarpon superellum]|nr:MAG: hypothetical protein M1838_001943 [Thelocarpon superellum]